jgi:hypothetical protein
MLSVIGKVNARLQTKLKTEIGSPYYGKTLNLTSTSESTPSEFPTLNVNSLGEPTKDTDLEQLDQATILSTVELRAYSNSTLSETQTLIDNAGNVMMSMRYSLIYGPTTLSDVKPYCKLARFRRIVGNGDSLY